MIERHKGDNEATWIEEKESKGNQHTGYETHFIISWIFFRIIIFLALAKREILEMEAFDELNGCIDTFDGVTKRRRKLLQSRVKSSSCDVCFLTYDASWIVPMSITHFISKCLRLMYRFSEPDSTWAVCAVNMTNNKNLHRHPFTLWTRWVMLVQTLSIVMVTSGYPADYQRKFASIVQTQYLFRFSPASQLCFVPTLYIIEKSWSQATRAIFNLSVPVQ